MARAKKKSKPTNSKTSRSKQNSSKQNRSKAKVMGGKKSQSATKKGSSRQSKAQATPVRSTAMVKKTLAVGDATPRIMMSATGGKIIGLGERNGKKLVLYFYPKDMTPGCTIEGHEFSKLKNDFESLNAEVYGVSRDTLALHEKFKEKECYSIDLVSDVNEELCNLFAVIKDKNMYGKIVKGIERSTFLIDENGVLLNEWRGVKAPGHAQAVYEFLASLK